MLSDYRIVENINEYLVTLGTGQSLADSLDQFIAVGLLLLLAFSANFICRTVLLHVVTKLVKNTKVTWDDGLFDKKVLVNLSRMVAPVLIYVLLPVVFPREPDVVSFLQRLCMIYIIATFLRFINVFLLAIYHVYSEKEQFKDRPLKGLLQTAQVTLFFIGGSAIVVSDE
jgi:miniconductance mechanosensitive channel